MKVIIFGGGNMGGAIAKGLSRGIIFNASNITVIDPSQSALDSIQAFDSRIRTLTEDFEDKMVKDADFVIVALKPWLIEDFLKDKKQYLDYSKQIIISIAAGVDFLHLNQALQKENGPDPVIFRVIPNTAIEVNESMTFISSCNASPTQEKWLVDIFNEMGKTLIIKEDDLPTATTLGSCGIAFVFRYIRACMEAGIESGFGPELSKEIILQTMKGAIEILTTKKTHPEVEIDRVTTPGGITIKGLNRLEEYGFTNAVIQGVKACNQASK